MLGKFYFIYLEIKLVKSYYETFQFYLRTGLLNEKKKYICCSNTYKVSNNGQLIKLEQNIVGARTLIVTDDDGSLESADDQSSVMENGNLTGIVMSKANDINITQYELRPNNNSKCRINIKFIIGAKVQVSFKEYVSDFIVHIYLSLQNANNKAPWWK